MTRLLPKIDTQIAFRRFAKARGLEASTYEDACRVDLTMRREGVGYVPSALLKAWYKAHGRSECPSSKA